MLNQKFMWNVISKCKPASMRWGNHDQFYVTIQCDWTSTTLIEGGHISNHPTTSTIEHLLRWNFHWIFFFFFFLQFYAKFHGIRHIFKWNNFKEKQNSPNKNIYKIWWEKKKRPLCIQQKNLIYNLHITLNYCSNIDL